LIREWLKEWTDTAPKLEIKIRKEVVKVEGKGGVSKMKEEKEVIGKTRKDETKKEDKENEVITENDRKYEEIQRAARKERLEY
jgi:hypothetical protein